MFYIYAGIYSAFTVGKEAVYSHFRGHEVVIQEDGPGLQCLLVCKEAQQKSWATLQGFPALLSQGHSFGLLFLEVTTGDGAALRGFRGSVCTQQPELYWSCTNTNPHILTMLEAQEGGCFHSGTILLRGRNNCTQTGPKSKYRSLNVWKQKLTA